MAYFKNYYKKVLTGAPQGPKLPTADDLLDAYEFQMDKANDLCDAYAVNAAIAKKAAATVKVTEPGMYAKDGSVYRVVVAKTSGNLYAKKFVGTSAFDYEAGKGAMAFLTPDDRMTLEQVKAIGLETGICCVCSATLTDPKSIEAGIGPVCAKRV